MTTDIRNIIHNQYLTIGGVQVKNYAMVSGTGEYSDPIRSNYSNGFANLLILLTGGSDDLDISIQVSIDGKTWYTPNTTNGTTLTSAGGIVTTLTSSTWIDISSRVVVAPYIRFFLDPDANSTVTAFYMQQE